MPEIFVSLKKAADQGDAEAQCNLGVMYQDGKGVEKDVTKAAAYYQKAADQGSAKAQCNLGWMYFHGEGVEKDVTKAAAYYQKAADQGNLKAQNKMLDFED